MKKIFLLLLILGALTGCVVKSKGDFENQEKMREYINGDVGFALNYPDKFQIIELDKEYYFIPNTVDLTTYPLKGGARVLPLEINDENIRLAIGKYQYPRLSIRMSSQGNVSMNRALINGFDTYEFNVSHYPYLLLFDCGETNNTREFSMTFDECVGIFRSINF